jgi:flagellar biosynthesis protein FlhG
MTILPIGSGKGGVGKSLLAVNLSIALAEAGRRVVLADLDLGASNAHTMLGIRGVSRGIGTFLSVPRTTMDEVVLPTEYENLSFVPGDAEVPGIATLKAPQKKRLVRALESLPADFLVLDLGPGAGANALDFFLLGAGGIVVTTPALTSVLNAYLFMKNVVFRLLFAAADKESKGLAILEDLRRDPGGVQRAYVPRILERVAREDPATHALMTESLARLRPRLVLNMVQDPAETDKAEKLRRSAREYLGVDFSHLGVAFRDELQSVALASRVPIVRYKPGCVLSRAIFRMAEKLVAAEKDPRISAPWRPGTTGGLDAEDELPALEAEAEADFKGMQRDIEDLLRSGALTMADLVESVRTQQLELTALRRDNTLLRARVERLAREGSRS